MRQNITSKMRFLQSVKCKLENFKLLNQRIFFTYYSWFFKFYDKVFKIERKYVIVEKRALNKRLSLNNEQYAGLRAGSVIPSAQLNNILVNGKYVSPFYKFKPSDQVVIPIRPLGDDPLTNVVVAVAAIAVAVFFPAAAPYATQVAAFSLQTALNQLLFPLPDQQGSEFDSSDDQPEITGAKNTVSRGVVPVLFGKSKITPYYGQNPYRLVTDGSSGNKYRQYLIPANDNITVSDEKLGDTPVSDFSSEYLTITRSFGGASFIGFDNVKVVQKNEQLTFDTDGAVDQTVNFVYNQPTTTTSVQYDFILEFTDVVIGSWSDKTFEVTITGFDGATAKEFSQSFTVTSGDLTLVSGTTYRYNGTHTFSETLTELEQTSFKAITSTRENIEEQDSQLNVEIIEQEITTDDFNVVTLLGNGVNNYAGILTESIITSPENTYEVDIIFSFPQGLYRVGTDGIRYRIDLEVEAEFKEVGGSYQPISNADGLYIRDIDGNKQPLSSSSTEVVGSTITMTAPEKLSQADELFYRVIGVELPAGQYIFRFRSPFLEKKTDTWVGIVQVAEANFYVQGDVLNTDNLPNLTQYSVDALAYKQLSGELQQFNFIAQAQIPNWNGSDWSTVDVTRNPASVIRYLLTDSRVNPRAEDISKIDNDSLVELWEWCDVNNYYADGYINDPTKFINIIQAILGNCRASFTFIDGKYFFTVDNPNKPIVNQITPHNSFNFKYTPALGKTTDAVRVSYTSEDDYKKNEFTIYYYDGDTHEARKAGTVDIDYEMLKQDARFTTNEAHLKSITSYNLKTIQEKRRLYEFDVNLESLAINLYDRILVTNTTTLEKPSTGLIKNVITSGGNLVGFELNCNIEIATGDKITIRSVDTANIKVEINTFDIVNNGYTNIVQIAPVVYNGIIKGQGTMSGFTSGAEWFYDGDLFEIGQNKIVECVVLNVRYGDNFTATITAREA